MKATMLALVERATCVLHAANMSHPRIDCAGVTVGIFAVRTPFAPFAA